MRRLQRLALGLTSILLAGAASFSSGCGDSPSTSSSGSGSGSTSASSTSGNAGGGGNSSSSGTAGMGGAGGVAGMGGMGGTGGVAGMGGMGGNGGAGGIACTDEVCDGDDNDCDGQTDEGCLCINGDTLNCYSGPAGTEGVGECKTGAQTCDLTGTFGPCTGEIGPMNELCDGLDNDCNGAVDDGLGTITCGLGACQVTVAACEMGIPGTCEPLMPAPEEACNGIDDTCDGTIDEGCSCIDGQTQSCYSGPAGTEGVGSCAAGQQTCANGAWGACVGDVLPEDESCNGKDDNCDGQTDENLGSTSCGTGACHVTIDNCKNGAPQTCVPGNPAPEICNGIDDDCNFNTDDGLGTTSCGVGECAATVAACVNGQTNTCVPNAPTSEVCDNKDNDCDGQTDNGNPGGGGACMTGQAGECSVGVLACASGQVICTQSVFPQAEVCDGKDNNCDGATDDGNPGSGIACNTGKLGLCAPGTTACTSGAIVCNQNVQPTPEACDGLDNDCNGQADNGNPGGGMFCNTGQPGICATGTTTCSGGAIVCNQATAPNTELCDGLDNNCDGTTDDGNPGGGVACNSGKPGVCAPGTTACTNGSVVCNQNVQPSAESCDGLDNNCNGTVDDGNPGGGANCNTGKLGACAPGTTSCTNGSIVCNQNVQSSAETCDGIDNDCDGQVDEGNPGGGMACNTGLQGVCSAGTSACTNGMIVCNQNVQPSAETCDGKDNNCNGAVDDGNPGGGMACNTGLQGVCSAGTSACTNGAIVCNQNVQPSAETCDGLDNNCNGAADEGNPGGGGGCSTGKPGVCSAGTLACSGGGLVCNQNVQPTTEVCDGLDNNCSGAVDEGNPGGGNSCNTGQQGVCSAGTTACSSGALVCNQNVQPSAETCDGKDNNCNGSVDDGNPGGGIPCSTGLPGICSTGATICNGGMVQCAQTVMPTSEVCDGLDNNCNGAADEGNPGGGGGCNTGKPGVCSAGTLACSGGGLVCNQNVQPTTEVCDGLDNNCSGATDEGNPGGGLACNTGLPGICNAGTTVCSSGAIACTQNNSPQTEICDGIDNNCSGATDEMNPTTACSAQYPGAGNVSGFSCGSGMCGITGCNAGYANIDGAIVNGCECQTDLHANVCTSAATTNVAVGASTDWIGKIETAAGNDWMTFTFTDRPVGQPFHPRVQLTDSAGGQFAMDVQTSCGTPAACSPAGNGNNTENGINVTTWEHFNSAYIPGAGCCSDNTPHVTSVKVRVYRKNGDAPTCMAYKVTASNL